MIRFHIKQGDSLTSTAWEEEPVKYGVGQPHTAVERMIELRKTYGNDARISIERTTVIPAPDRKQVRFRIALPKDETRYSRPYPISEKDEALIRLQKQFPKAEITAEEING